MSISVSEHTVARMLEWRHRLHTIPELAYQEHKTADFVAARLADMGLKVERGLAGTGVVGILEGRGSSDRVVGFRCELDALPISETTAVNYRSRHDGIMHACGHDGHMAMVLGAADHLSGERDFAGTAIFVFQPAEENEGGGRRMVDEGLFARYPIGSIYAVHNWPGVAEGHIAVRPGAMMARFDTFDFGIKGQGGHAALPHLMRDPMIAAGQVIVAVQSIVARNIDAFEQAVVSITFVNGGEVYNVVPDVVRIGGTVRTLDDAVQDRVEARLKAIATGLSQSLEVEIDFTYERKFPITSNATREAEIAQRAARRVVGKEAVETDFRPSMGAEDFSVMLQNCPGAFAFLGVGPSIPGAGLHQSSYDFNDRVLGLGASYYTAIVSEELS